MQDKSKEHFDSEHGESLDQIILRMRRLLSDLPEELRLPDPESPRGKILTSARRAFAENGFKGTSTRVIADEAKVNLAMIHYYFGNKARLYKRVLTYAIIGLFTEISKDLINYPMEERLIALPFTLMKSLRDDQDKTKLLRREFADGGVNFKEIVIEMGDFGPKGFRRIIHDTYMTGKSTSKLKDLPMDSVLRLLITLGYSMLFMAPIYEAVLGTSLDDEDVWKEQITVNEQILKYGLMKKRSEDD
ncbi:MAG: TetR family transcriptional regulator [Candidatus Electryonea clarkiae]|nr:TetR family transcriptional regulator [Candidatus Electryonea clarkiae]MDP8287511.1 TetR family transcriptional regulator [Candidatus Electryonea clarkiae]